MNSFERRIIETPIKDFQLGNSLDNYRRDKQLDKEGIKVMLQAGPILFAVADVGHKLEIIDTNRCFEFWKAEVEQHLADTSRKNHLEDYPGEHMYFASKWIAKNLSPIILLEKQH